MQIKHNIIIHTLSRNYFGLTKGSVINETNNDKFSFVYDITNHKSTLLFQNYYQQLAFYTIWNFGNYSWIIWEVRLDSNLSSCRLYLKTVKLEVKLLKASSLLF